MILHLTEACGAGVARHLALLLPALRKRGVSVALLLYGNRFDHNLPAQVEHLRAEVVLVFERPCRHPLLEGRMILRSVCRGIKPALIHAHAFKAGWTARLSGCAPVCYSPHAFASSSAIPWVLRTGAMCAERLLMPRTRAWIFVHPAEDTLGCPAERSFVVPNGIPAIHPLSREEARRLLGIPLEERTIAAPCRLVPQKNLFVLMDALALLPPKIVLRIYGSGPLRNALLEYASRKNFASRLFLHEETGDFPQKMSAFDTVVLPSLYEGCSYVLLEGLAAGVPVVASEIPANHLTTATDRIIHYFPPKDASQLATAIQEALDTAPLPIRPFTLDAQADALATLYRQWEKDGTSGMIE